MFPHIMPNSQFHLNAKVLKLINLSTIDKVNVHENGVSLIHHTPTGQLESVSLHWSDVEQLHLSLANALSLRNIKGWRE